MSTDDHYIPPDSGWCCFWCGEVFPPYGIHVQRAREHFGITEGTEPGCVMRLNRGDRGLLSKVRELEEELDEVRRQRLNRPGYFRDGAMLGRGPRMRYSY